MNKYTDLKIAIVHDSIQYFGGAERVLTALSQAFPNAHIYTSVISWERLGPFEKKIKEMNIKTSWVQRIPIFRMYPFLFRYLLPFIWRSFDLSDYDIIISSSGSQMSHLVQKGKNAVHVCYCFTPPRHLYGYKTDYPWEQVWIVQYVCKMLNYFLRNINERAVRNVDLLIACSKEAALRIKKFYNRDSVVVYPPISFSFHKKAVNKKGSYYLSVSRLSRMKHVDLIIQVMNKLHKPLHVVGSGPEEKYLKSIAGKTITFFGTISDESLARQYKGCKALICAAEDEDFGMTPLEAISYGKPVIAYFSGGYRETIVEGKTGIFFYHLTRDAIVCAITSNKLPFVDNTYPKLCVQSFSTQRFIRQMRLIVQNYDSMGLP